MRVKIYAEGGGTGEFLDSEFRRSWQSFSQRAGVARGRLNIVRCGGRQSAYDDFTTALRHRRTDELPLLLVDSEAPVTSGYSSWQHLQWHDGWAWPNGSGDDQVFLMVQVMETWIIADRQALRECCGPHLNEQKIPNWPGLEEVDKSSIYEALKSATAGCPRGKQYAKGVVSFRLLATLDPLVVESRCPSAKGLLDHLRTLTNA